MPITDHTQRIRQLEARVEELEHERDGLQEAIADHVEALGHEGNDATALLDSRGQIERLLEGKDIARGLGLVGIAGQVEALVKRSAELTSLRKEICAAAGKRHAYPLAADFSSHERARLEGAEHEAKRRGWEWPIDGE